MSTRCTRREQGRRYRNRQLIDYRRRGIDSVHACMARRRWRHRLGAIREERGSAVLEFIVVGVLVLVPLAYVVISVMTVQAATLASTQAVREAARAFSTSDSVSQGNAAAVTAAQVAFEDQGFTLPKDALLIGCPGGCLEPGSSIDVRLSWGVDLPWLPASLAESRAMTVPIEAVHTAPVDSYRLTLP